MLVKVTVLPSISRHKSIPEQIMVTLLGAEIKQFSGILSDGIVRMWVMV